MRPKVSVIVLLAIALVTLVSHADIPQITTYQGKVTDAGARRLQMGTTP